MIRTFVAVKVPRNARLREAVNDLGAFGRALKPVSLEGLHITLMFLGDTVGDQLEAIKSHIASTADQHEPFRVHMRGLGAFPNPRRPSVVWVGLDNPGGELSSLAASLHDGLAELGFGPDRYKKFKPHVTVARVKAKPPPELSAFLDQQQTTDFGEFEVQAIDFIESQLTPRGAVYSSLGEYGLGKH